MAKHPIDNLLTILHTLYCNKHSTESFEEIKKRMSDEVSLYLKIARIMDRLSIDVEEFVGDLKAAIRTDTIDKWSIWAMVDSNLAKIGRHGHTRKPKENLDGGQTTQDSPDRSDSPRPHREDD